MAKQTGTEEMAMRSSGTRPKSCANCARPDCPFPRFSESSPKTGIATLSSSEFRDALCWPQNERNHSEVPGVEPSGSWNNWRRCFPECTRLAGPGAIASRRTFLFIAALCDSSISREHAAMVKLNYCHGVRRIMFPRDPMENSPDAREHSKMITRSVRSHSNSCPENSRPPQLIAGQHSTSAHGVRRLCGRKLSDC